MGARLEESTFSELSEEEERALLARQRVWNIRLGLILGAVVVLILVMSFLLMVRSGFVPFQNQDVFRSA